MTHILQHQAPVHSKALTATTVGVLAMAGNAAAAALHLVSCVPAVIGGAFAMAYVEPYRPRNCAKDPADPRYF